MNREKSSKELEELLAKSIEALRASQAEREKYPALNRLLSRIESRQQQIPGRGASAWRLVRPFVGPLSSAAAGFAGAAVALLLLMPAASPIAPAAPGAVAAAPHAENADAARRLSRSIHRLERAIHGLEKFQPLIESRVESLEDALQRKHADAYASGEDMSRSQDPFKSMQVRQDRGAFF